MGFFEENFNLLNNTELNEMKILFASLKELSDEEIKVLSDKYRVSEEDLKKYNKPLNYRKFVSDQVVADKNGISRDQYITKRHKAEAKLNYHIRSNSKKYKGISTKETVINDYK